MEQGFLRTSRRKQLVAAGAVIWRVLDGRLQVLMIHRPKYSDWSWPKGKLENRETPPIAAIREVKEETGLDVRLGIPLPTANYTLGTDTDKTVYYWAAQGDMSPLPAPPRPNEVDICEWVDADLAGERLSRRGDQIQLDAVIAAYQQGRLETWPLIVLRHAAAYDRKVWTDGEDSRPLLDIGWRQSDALVHLLAAWKPRRIYTSPWRRCLQTVSGFAEAHGVKVRTKKPLTEIEHRKEPLRVARLIGRIFAKNRPAVICTHRPVLGTTLGALAGRASADLRECFPQHDPFLEKGEILVADISIRSGRVVSIARYVPLPELDQITNNT